MAKLERFPWLILTLVAVVACVTQAQPGRGQEAAEIVTEPGYVAPDGSWVVTVTASAETSTAALAAVDLAVYRDGEQLEVKERLAFPLQGGGQTTALAVVLDLPLLAGDVVDAWSEALAKLLDRSVTRGALVSVARCGSEATVVPRPGSQTRTRDQWDEMLAATQPGKLWDNVVEGIRAVGDPDLPERRVLLLVSDGREEVVSRHVLASCIEAALRARVAIYVLSVAANDDSGAGTARLRELARRTGGRELSGGRRPASRLAEILAVIGSAKGLRLAAASADLPAEISVRWSHGADARAGGEIARRESVRRPGAGRWMIVGAALLMAAGAGFLIWRQRAIVVGDLWVRTRNGVRRFPVPQHGVTVGRAEDNNLVLSRPVVAQHHAVIRIKDGRVIITDLRSSRGTTVNNEPIATRHLASGDRIVIGGAIEMVFKDHRTGD